MKRAFVFGMAAFVSAGLGGACAPATTGGETGEPNVLRVEVRNNYPTAVTREVFIAEPGSSPRRIGQIPAAATRRLDARAIDWQVQHVLLAESLTGDVIESTPFFVSPGGRVVWDLANNRVEVIEP